MCKDTERRVWSNPYGDFIMNLILTRTDFTENGIFSTLCDTDGNQIAVTLEHAYDSGNGDGSYLPKIPVGTFTCKRSQHRLEGMTQDFTTFQVMDVPNHTNILFHWGNFNKDSDGCILLGNERNGDMIMNSKTTFSTFMALQDGVDEFTLVVA